MGDAPEPSMRKLVALVALAVHVYAEHSPFRIVGYLPEYRMGGADFDWLVKAGTDVILFSLQPKHTGALDTSAISPKFIEQATMARSRNGGRVFICIGGAGRSATFPAVAADGFLRKRFARQLTGYCNKHKLDGVDFDWEAPGDATQLKNYGLLLAAVKESFAEHGLKVTVAVHVWQTLDTTAIGAVDGVHLMAYDAQEATGRHSTLETAVQYVTHMTGAQKGDTTVLKSKLLLGVPAYGRNRNNPGDVKTYGEIVRDNQVKADQDELPDGMYWNGPSTVMTKARWAHKQGLAGIMVWELGQDSGDESSSLLAALRVVQNEVTTQKKMEL